MDLTFSTVFKFFFQQKYFIVIVLSPLQKQKKKNRKRNIVLFNVRLKTVKKKNS